MIPQADLRNIDEEIYIKEIIPLILEAQKELTSDGYQIKEIEGFLGSFNIGEKNFYCIII